MPLLISNEGRAHEDSRAVLEIEARRAVTYYRFPKDFFEVYIMYNSDYLFLQSEKIYRKKKDARVYSFFLRSKFIGSVN
jgi:hypothetical protein